MEGMEKYYSCKDHNEPMGLPPGFRFHPTDEELITYYLARKIAYGKFRDEAIAEVDLNKYEPWDLPGKAQMVGEKEWYFYTRKDRKYPSGSRTNRATKSGYWKATGKDKDVLMKTSAISGHCKQRQLVGMKKTLVFYEGRAPKGSKSNWVMHEYRMDEEANIASMLGNGFTKLKSTKEPWVLCRVFHKKLRHGESKKDMMYSQEEDAEMLTAAAHFLLADDERGRGGAAAAYINKLAKLHLDVVAPLLNLAGADKCGTTTAASQSTACRYIAASKWATETARATEIACEPALSYLMQEQYTSQHVEDYSRIDTAGCTSTASSTGQYSGGDFSNYATFSNHMNGCASSDAWLPANSTASASTPLPRFPSELESLWVHAPAFFV